MSDVDTPLGVRLATGRNLDDVLGILAEGSPWALRKGVAQWPERFSRDVLRPTVERGELFVVYQSGPIEATITLLWRDPTFWGERDDAGVVHRLAIRRSARGLGARLIEWADGEASANRRGYLCLSCLSSNVRLRRYFEDLGFGYSGEVFGPLEHPHTAEHGSWSAALYERRVRDRVTSDAEELSGCEAIEAAAVSPPRGVRVTPAIPEALGASSAYGSPMILWSYKLERFDLMAQPDGHTAAETALNARGAEGWELVGIHDVDSFPFAIYKRPVDIGEADE